MSTETRADRYRDAVAYLASIAERAGPRTPALRAAIHAMREGSILPPAMFVAPAFLPQVCPDFLAPFAEAAVRWVAAERARDAAHDCAMAMWRSEAPGAWTDTERSVAMIEACSASSAARLGVALVEG